MNKDVTRQVEHGFNDGECLPITKCVCGQKFHLWDFIVTVYEKHPSECPECKRKLYFSPEIKIYEVVEE